MNSYISNLIGRTQQALPVLSPRPVSMFEDSYTAAAAEVEEDVTAAPETGTAYSSNRVQQQTAVSVPNIQIPTQHPSAPPQEPPLASTEPRETPISSVPGEKLDGNKLPQQSELHPRTDVKWPFSPPPTTAAKTGPQPNANEPTAAASRVSPSPTTTASPAAAPPQEPPLASIKPRETPVSSVPGEKLNDNKLPQQSELYPRTDAKWPFPPPPTTAAKTGPQPDANEPTAAASRVSPSPTTTASPAAAQRPSETAVLPGKSTPATLVAQPPAIITKVQAATPLLLAHSAPPIMPPLPASPTAQSHSETAVSTAPTAPTTTTQPHQLITPTQQQNNRQSLLSQTMPPVIPMRETAVAAQPAIYPQPASLSHEAAPASQTIQVKIGRIEVRASSPEPLPNPKKTRSNPALSLDEYLTQRQGGKS